MFLKQRNKNGKTYLSIVESYWDNGVSKHRTLASLGSADSFRSDELANLGAKLIALSGKKVDFLDIDSMTERRRVNWGCPAVCKRLWNDFDFDNLLRRLKAKTKIQFGVEESIFKIVSTRLAEPMSKLGVFRSQDLYQGSKDVDLQHIYRSLNFLCTHKDQIEEHIYKTNRHLFNMTVDVVFYDVTTLYFESSRPDAFKDFGYSKDCKFGEVQVVLGLIMNAEGRPVGFEYFPGNTFEGSTLVSALTKLKNRFRIDRVIVVADRGINSKINLKAIRDAGFHYIVGSRLKSMPQKIKDQVLDLTSYQCTAKNENGEEIFKVKEFSYDNPVKIFDEAQKKYRVEILSERLICSWSLNRAEKDKADRERLVKKAHNLIAHPSKVNDKRGAKRYIKPKKKVDDTPLVLDQRKICEDEKWDGFYGLQTSDPGLTPTAIMDAYKNLWKIEEIFRTLKSTLEMRPMFHWTPERIKGHLVACFLSFVFERTIELKVLQTQNHHLSSAAIQHALYSLQLSDISLNDRKIYLRSEINPDAEKILKAFDIKIPKSAELQS